MTSESYAESPWVRRAGRLRARAWIVCMAVVLAVFIGGSVTNHMSFTVAAITLATPAVISAGFAVTEWFEARRSGVLLARGHLAGPGVAVVLWLLTTAGGGGDLNFGKSWQCRGLDGEIAAACLRDAAHALHNGHIVSWTGLGVVFALGLLARRSRVAAWSTLPIAFAAQTLALHFLLPLKETYGL